MTRRLVLPLLAALLSCVAALVSSSPASAAAEVSGGDVSWPQCPVTAGQRGYGLPLPGAGTGFVVVGLTAGLPFQQNPCLDSQLAHVGAIGAQLAVYTFAAMPTAQQLRADGSSGPYDAGTPTGQLGNAGYAQGLWSAEVISSRGLQVPLVWVDVEHRKVQSWSSSAAANRAVIAGAVKALQDSGFAVGFYSYKAGWDEITGGLRSPLPVWATAGRRGRSAAAAMCAKPSFSGGPVVLAQWYDSVRDSDLVCPAAASPAAAGTTVQRDGLAAYRHLVLRRGSHGPAVSALRLRLGIPASPEFSRATALAVRSFQARRGLAVDGVVGQATWRALGAFDAPRPSGPEVRSRFFARAPRIGA